MWTTGTFWCLAVWAFIFGLLTVTTVDFTWSKPIMGFAVLILGIVCILRNLRVGITEK